MGTVTNGLEPKNYNTSMITLGAWSQVASHRIGTDQFTTTNDIGQFTCQVGICGVTMII